jgi:hypothetical protein
VGSKAQTLHSPTFCPRTTNRIEGQKGQDIGAERDRALTILSEIGPCPKLVYNKVHLIIQITDIDSKQYMLKSSSRTYHNLVSFLMSY